MRYTFSAGVPDRHYLPSMHGYSAGVWKPWKCAWSAMHRTRTILAEQLENHPAISWLKYPFLKSHPQYGIAKKQMKNGGGLFCFELKGGLEGGRKFLDNLKMLSRTANLGDTGASHHIRQAPPTQNYPNRKD